MQWFEVRGGCSFWWDAMVLGGRWLFILMRCNGFRWEVAVHFMRYNGVRWEVAVHFDEIQWC